MQIFEKRRWKCNLKNLKKRKFLNGKIGINVTYFPKFLPIFNLEKGGQKNFGPCRDGYPV